MGAPLKKKQKQDSKQEALRLVNQAEGPAPDFQKLLSKPSIDQRLPTRFDVAVEAEHLLSLWDSVSQFRNYKFEQFVHAGGSGIVFRVKERGSTTDWAIKVARIRIDRGPAVCAI
jgi:hypothetical protein